MEQLIKFKASDEKSYTQLADFAAGLAANDAATIQFYPLHFVINIEKSCADVAVQFIAEKSLNIGVCPIDVYEDNIDEIASDDTSDSYSLHLVIDFLYAKINEIERKNEESIAELKKSREDVKKDLLNYQKWYGESINQRDRIRKQVEAIAVLMNSILTPEY